MAWISDHLSHPILRTAAEASRPTPINRAQIRQLLLKSNRDERLQSLDADPWPTDPASG